MLECFTFHKTTFFSFCQVTAPSIQIIWNKICTCQKLDDKIDITLICLFNMKLEPGAS